MNTAEKLLIQKIVQLLVLAGLVEEQEDEFYLTKTCVEKLASFPEGLHFLRLLREEQAVEITEVSDEF